MNFLITVFVFIISSSTLTGAQNDSSTSPCLSSQHCLNDTCHDNKCTFGCEEGYYGRMCSTPCNPGCTNHKCLQSGIDQGSCTEGCVDGRWGYKCSKACSTACVKCDRLNGSVCQECDGYHYGQLCQSNCYEKCSDTGCDRNGNCRGKLHSSRCGYNCIDCDEGTGSCKLCKAGYAGETCMYCKNCNGTCSDDGCTEGCVTGFHGATCLELCSSYCLDGCFQPNGTCKHGCRSGYYGMSCNKRCPEDCAQDVCDRNLGRCMGCKVGFYGPSCVIKCSNCLSGLCHQSNGNCTVQCIDGYYGPKCNMKCDKHCDYNRCNRISGICNKGSTGTGGSAAKPANATAATGKPEPSLFAILGPIGILLLCCTIVGLLLFKFCNSPCLQKKRENKLSSEKVLTRALPDPPEDTNHDSYYAINEDDMDPSNQSYARKSRDSETLPKPTCSEDTIKSQNLTSTTVASTTPSLLIQEDCQNDEAVDAVISVQDVRPESEKLINVREASDSIPLHEASRTLLSDTGLISRVENSTYRKGFLSRHHIVQEDTQLCVPKQYLTPVTDGESQF